MGTSSQDIWDPKKVEEFMDEYSQVDFQPGFQKNIKSDFEPRLIPICKPHGNKMYDSKADTYYCPICEQ